MQNLLRLAGFVSHFLLACWPMCVSAINVFRLFSFQTTSKYYKGGFERKMSRREAALILGVS